MQVENSDTMAIFKEMQHLIENGDMEGFKRRREELLRSEASGGSSKTQKLCEELVASADKYVVDPDASVEEKLVMVGGALAASLRVFGSEEGVIGGLKLAVVSSLEIAQEKLPEIVENISKVREAQAEINNNLERGNAALLEAAEKSTQALAEATKELRERKNVVVIHESEIPSKDEMS